MKISLLLAFLFLTGCAVAIIYSSKGEELYYNKCSGCHRLHFKSEFTSEKWENILEVMSKKAKLNENEKKLIFDYLTKDSLRITKP